MYNYIWKSIRTSCIMLIYNKTWQTTYRHIILLLYFCIGNTSNVEWYSDHVYLNSPSTGECEEVIKELKKQETKIHWWIALKSLSPDSSLIVFSNLNECLVRRLNIWNTSLDFLFGEYVLSKCHYNIIP